MVAHSLAMFCGCANSQMSKITIQQSPNFVQNFSLSVSCHSIHAHMHQLVFLGQGWGGYGIVEDKSNNGGIVMAWDLQRVKGRSPIRELE